MLTADSPQRWLSHPMNSIYSKQLICSTPNVRPSQDFYLCHLNDGRLCIEKSLIPGRDKLPKMMTHDEIWKTNFMQLHGLPVAHVVPMPEPNPHSIVTEFCGPSLRWLSLHPDVQGSDMASMWASATRASSAFTENLILMIDWGSRNTTFTLSQITNGQADFSCAISIDNALSIVAHRNANLQTAPIWIGSDQPSFAPELQAALRAEQEACSTSLINIGLLGGFAGLFSEKDRESWLEKIDISTNSIQQKIRNGELAIDPAIQYSIGQQAMELLALLRKKNRPKCQAAVFLRDKITVWEKMQSPLPSQRYPDLIAAAEAIQQGYPTLQKSSFFVNEIDFKKLISKTDIGTVPMSPFRTKNYGSEKSPDNAAPRAWSLVLRNATAVAATLALVLLLVAMFFR